MQPVPLVIGVLYVAAGGALGSAARYLAGAAITGTGFAAWGGTLAVNVVGAFLCGALHQSAPTSRTWLMFGTGVLGGFTTFSALTLDAVHHFGPLPDWRGSAYAVGSVGLGMAAFMLGGFCVRWVVAHR